MENKLIIKALLKAQKEMGNATKGTTNPFFKKKYADLNAVREVCTPLLNQNDIVVLQPTVHIDGKNFVKTLLLHVSGESIEGLTEVLFTKVNNPQDQGSGITYARRYGLQSLLSIGADDDDGNGASKPIPQPKPVVLKPTPDEARKQLRDCKTKDELKTTYLSFRTELQTQLKGLANDLKDEFEKKETKQ